MPRMRTLKPSFFTNDTLAGVHPLGRILFAGLWCIADRAGRLEDRPQRIKVEVLPYDKANVDSLLSELQERGFIDRYEVCGARFIQIVNFDKHQSPHVREPASTIPAPCSPNASTAFSGTSTPDPGSGIQIRDPDPVTDPDPEGARLTDEQEQLRVYLHVEVGRQVLKGKTAPDSDWCIDLIQRGLTKSDVEYAIQGALNIGTEKYTRAILLRRVEEREAGVDHDQLARDRAAAAARGDHTGARGSRWVARNGAGRDQALDEFGDAPPGSIRADDDQPRAAAGDSGARAPLRFTGRDRASGGAR